MRKFSKKTAKRKKSPLPKAITKFKKTTIKEARELFKKSEDCSMLEKIEAVEKELRRKKKKDKTLSWYRDTAWDLLSKIIRLTYSNSQGYCQCITCGKTLKWSAKKDGAQAGHFIDSRSNSILFVRIGIHPQCYSCNVCKHGNKVEYYDYMLKNYGLAVINHLRTLKHQVLKISREEYKEKITHYKEEYKKLLGKLR